MQLSWPHDILFHHLPKLDCRCHSQSLNLDPTEYNIRLLLIQLQHLAISLLSRVVSQWTLAYAARCQVMILCIYLYTVHSVMPSLNLNYKYMENYIFLVYDTVPMGHYFLTFQGNTEHSSSSVNLDIFNPKKEDTTTLNPKKEDTTTLSTPP